MRGNTTLLLSFLLCLLDSSVLVAFPYFVGDLKLSSPCTIKLLLVFVEPPFSFMTNFRHSELL